MTTIQNFAIDPNKLATARAKLIVALERDVNWAEFAKICGLTAGTICGIRNGRTGGNIKTLNKIEAALRSHGVTITGDSLLRPVQASS